LKAPAAIAVIVATATLPSCRTFTPWSSKVRSGVVVAAWAEPARLPPGGGQVMILVRIRRPNGEPYPGVQVQLKASEGTLFSDGKPLVTDANGMTRDRLTSRRAANIVVVVSDTRHRFRIPLASER
jgi:hypothetical protein